MHNRALAIVLLALLFPASSRAQETEAARLNKEGMQALAEKRIADAERIFRESVKAAEKLGRDELLVADSLNNLSAACYAQNKSDCALSTLRRVLKIRENVLGPDHADVAATWDHLGEVFFARESWQNVVTIMIQEMRVVPAAPGASWDATSFLLRPYRFDSLSAFDQATRVSVSMSMKETQSCFRKALAIRERMLPASHPDLMRSLYRLARVYVMERKLQLAEQLFIRLRDLKEKNFGTGHPEFAATLGDLARVYYFEGKFAEATGHYERALSIYDGTPDTDALVLAGCLFNLGEVYQVQKRFLEAEPLYLRTVSVLEKARGQDDVNLLPVLRAYALLLQDSGRKEEAKKVTSRADAIREKALQAKP